jgi:hypothetical protein
MAGMTSSAGAARKFKWMSWGLWCFVIEMWVNKQHMILIYSVLFIHKF